MQDPVLAGGDTAVNKEENVPLFMEHRILREMPA